MEAFLNIIKGPLKSHIYIAIKWMFEPPTIFGERVSETQDVLFPVLHDL